jgi:hypothetical protein
MRNAHGPVSHFPGFRKMCVMSVAKQKQIQESYLTYTSENKDQQKLPSENIFKGI